MPQIARRTTTSIVADELRNRILRGDIKEGEQVRQEAVANELGVSRIPVREALRLLEAEGLITLVSHKGAEVTRLEPSEIEELFEIRTMLEVWLIEHAMDAITEEDFAEAQKFLDAMRHAPVKDWGPLNWQFHEALYRAANKPTTLKLLKRVHDNADRYVRLQLRLSKDAQERAHRQHQALIDAAHMKDKYLASRLLTEHINSIKTQLIASVATIRTKA
ncbi:GntR family transcriptional regulator [uncultured Cohaesibacter sp.]|uniref:GntR family transcriptional regulator n=1 Tax=uncultured Cohaesibacter sp. TaxID=1002546 RepID=UPI0029C6EF7F|nr:GntR family transcriptional regulator [uncultured Cohaesibacter sp.]